MNPLVLAMPGSKMTVLWVSTSSNMPTDPIIEIDDFVVLISGSTEFRAKVTSVEGKEHVARITDCSIPGKEGKSLRFEEKHVKHLEKRHNGI
jgi:hypothetical protein